MITVGRPRTAYLLVTLLGERRDDVDAAVDRVADLLSVGMVDAARDLARAAARRAAISYPTGAVARA